MKHSFILIALTSVALLFTSGCKKTCEQWFEKDGKDCVEMREKFYGTYVGTFTQGVETVNGSMTLLKHGDGVQRILIQGGSTGTYFELTGSSTFDIPLQNLTEQGNTYTIQGNGSLSGNQLTYDLTQVSGSETSTLNFTGTK